MDTLYASYFGEYMDSDLDLTKLVIENLQLKVEIRKTRLQMLGMILNDIQEKVPLISTEIEALEIELEKYSPRPKIEAVK